ncbi:MAG: DUF3990 domain-containing protein [Clostridiales bacterium]|nr:DUF3990 domain-containing protein [Clostridiales bacterium]
MKIFHGSENRIEKPEYGKGKPYNDYGLGFYCTEDIEMAKEWSCGEDHDGFANEYTLDITGLKVLNLNAPEYTILHWLAVLLKNRTFRLTNPIAKDAKEYLLEHFPVNTEDYDIIIGYRADDSYFSFAEDFLNNAISVRKLEKAMRLGNLGEQVVLVSRAAFDALKFVSAEEADRSMYYVLKMKRDKAARAEYLGSDRKPSYGLDELYMLDIMRQGVKADDPRLR